MTRKVVDIQQEDGITTVFFQLSEFTNFGARLHELEQQVEDSLLNFLEGDEEELDEDMEELAEDMDMLRGQLDQELSKVRQESPDFASMIEDTTRELLSLIDDEDGDADSAAIASLLFDEDDDDEHAPDIIAVCLPDGDAWTAAYHQRAETFFDQWPDLRDAVRQAIYTYYCKFYDVFWELHEDHPDALIMLPEPTDIAQIDDRFIIHSLHLREDGSDGLEGDCLWDPVNGIGLLLQDGQVVRAGQAAVAFD